MKANAQINILFKHTTVLFEGRAGSCRGALIFNAVIIWYSVFSLHGVWAEFRALRRSSQLSERNLFSIQFCFAGWHWHEAKVGETYEVVFRLKDEWISLGDMKKQKQLVLTPAKPLRRINLSLFAVGWRNIDLKNESLLQTGFTVLRSELEIENYSK